MKRMPGLVNKRVVVGVTGGIAAYKSAELVRRLKEAGAGVRVVMTAAATQFITPLTLQALSGKPVHVRLLDAATENAMSHIELARWADVIVVAPAGANTMAKLAQGLADDLLSTLCLASTAPLVLVPAMNHVMWDHPATQTNRQVLESRGVRLLGPAQGDQACGETGHGRMVEPPEIVTALIGMFAGDSLQGTKIIITAGPTREAIDPVRFLSNRSSGKMGYALAEAAAEAGAEVKLVSGPVNLPCPSRVERVIVESAAQMHATVMKLSSDGDIFVAAAAVADYTVPLPEKQKIKKGEVGFELHLERTPDIVASVAALPRHPFIVGFAAETEELERNARSKLEAKNLDMVAANWVGRPDQGFESDNNALTVVWRGGGTELPPAPKSRLARQLIQIIAERYHAQYTN
jgi:phosphopantothenoylcysteine decarboxylase / phosphopantothenate---cysteine ligase